MRVAVIGAGYVGLVAAGCLSHSGHDVVCIEKDARKMALLKAGRVPFFEEGLEELVLFGLKRGLLQFDGQMEACQDREIIMIAVGTPARPDGRIDLSQIYAVMDEIVFRARFPQTIVMKSTVPPGFGVNAKERYLERARVPLSYLSNPEFLREGSAVRDWYHPDRIVIGGDDETAISRLARLYAGIDAPIVTMDVSSAEMVKYAANAFLATKISFINEIASLCELVGADILPVSRAVGMDRRIGDQFLQAGLGYGGSCFPKDTCGLDFVSTCNGHAFNLLKAVIEVNKRQRLLAVRRLRHVLGRLHGKTIGVLGLAFKPGTDDVRESPSLEIINLLLDEGADVRAYDPLAMENARRALPDGVFFAPGVMEAVTDCHALLVATAWPEFSTLDWAAVRPVMHPPYLVMDGRNCLAAEELRQKGFLYWGIGRPYPVQGETRNPLIKTGQIFPLRQAVSP
ncbi:nucleotide sugar dehydrogenase [Desulfofundulus thermobenzoicus]|uniref:UDP-glucose 6-dehydrogenase n=1 Tax=Desulfofundulus thermobenzoicus TaxID=29376 RepID=A0A6N7IPN1_9FIRM|nr:UDP-glucose/GDP-mannose dehydrogenase family protein [Desulfofundulus thermobenzoicus]MQL51996.1 nucleotide sugar dehydrogenase [Desulfofundulus thermobenzoicus]